MVERVGDDVPLRWRGEGVVTVAAGWDTERRDRLGAERRDGSGSKGVSWACDRLLGWVGAEERVEGP